MEENENSTPMALIMSVAIVPVFFVLASLCVGLTVLIYYLVSNAA
jgi:hypothetical protein